MDEFSDAIFFKDLESRFLAVSRQLAREMHVEAPEQMIGKTDADFFTTHIAENTRRDEKEIIETGRPIIGKIARHVDSKGDMGESWVTVSKRPLRDENGKIVGTFGISRDVTDRELAVQALRQRNEQMQLEMQRARMIQQALLPDRRDWNKRLKIEYKYLPMDLVGGDFFSFLPIDETSLGVVIGDVAGHGVSAALFTALVKFLSDRIASEYGRRPAEYLARLNSDLMERMPMAFMTAAYCVFDFSDPGCVSLTMAGAGHPEPILYREETGETVAVELQDNAALGVIADFETEETRLTLETGDRLFLYSDGITETDSPWHQQLGLDRLTDFLGRGAPSGLSARVQSVIDAIGAYRGDGPVSDDITLIGCEIV